MKPTILSDMNTYLQSEQISSKRVVTVTLLRVTQTETKVNEMEL